MLGSCLGSHFCLSPLSQLSILHRFCVSKVRNGQLSLIFGVPNFCVFSLLVLCLFKAQVEAKRRKKLGTAKIRDSWPFPKKSPDSERVRKSGFRLCLNSFETPGRTLSGLWVSRAFRDSFQTLPGFRALRVWETLCGAGPITSLAQN